MLCTCTLYQHIRIAMYNNIIHKNVNFHQLNDEPVWGGLMGYWISLCGGLMGYYIPVSGGLMG